MKTKAIVIMMFVVAGFVVPSLADFPTVGLYDPTDAPHFNDVDQSGTFDSGTGGADANNVLAVADFMPGGYWDPNDAFVVDMGGVVDFEGTSDPCLVDQTIIYAIYGTNGLKTVDITGTDGTLSIGSGINDTRTPTSGNYRLSNSNNDFNFDIGVTDGDDYEQVVVFGGTVLDRRFHPIAPEVTATFSDGSTVTSDATIGDSTLGGEDTFFGFVAPVDAYIVSVNFNLDDKTFIDDLVFITDIMNATIDAGPGQTVDLYDVMAGNGSVQLDATVVLPHTTEGYDYTWTSDPATGVVFTDATDEDPTVTFTTAGVYTLTVDLDGDEGADSYDDVIITVIVPTVDAGPTQSASSGEWVELDSTIINPYEPAGPNEVYTYLWSGDWDSISDATEADPNAIFTGAGKHVVTLNVTGSIYGPLVADTVDIHIVTDANWVGATGGDWDTAGNWAPSGVPDSAYAAQLGNETAEADLALTTVEVDVAVSVNGLALANDPNYPYTLNVNGGVAVETVVDLNIGSQDTGIVNVLGASPITIGGRLIIGDDDGVGTLSSALAASTITIGDDLIIGDDDGVGTFSALAGSTVDIGDDLDVGDEGDGTFNMTGGTLNVGVDVDEDGDINVSRDDGGTGDMTLDGVTVNCDDDFLVASNGDDEGGTGVGTVTITNNSVIVIGDNLLIGEYGSTGTFTATDSSIDVNGEVEVGRRSSGTLILNDTDITTDDDGELRVGVSTGGDGEVIMNGGSSIETDDYVSIGGGIEGGGGGNGVGTLTMNDSSALVADRDLIVCKKEGTGTLTMNDGSSIVIGDDFHVAKDNTAVGIVVMTGGEINVGDEVVFGGQADNHGEGTGWDPGDDTMCRLTMSGDAHIYSDSKFWFAIEPDPDKAGSGNRNELKMSGNAKISVQDEDSNMYIANYAGSYAYVEIDNEDNNITCQNLEIGNDGGGCDFDIEYGSIDIKNHLKVASSVDYDPSVAPVNIVIHNGATITLENDIEIGGEGAQVTIELIDGTIDQTKTDDWLSMPDSGPSGEFGYCHIILGVDANDLGGHDPGDAEIKCDSILDSVYATIDKDYFDFLGAGRLTMQQNKITEPNIVDHIISGYFRTSYGTVEAWTDLDGVVPSDPNVFRVVYESVDGGDKWRIELGIGSPCAAGVSPLPSEADRDSDCDVDIDDLYILVDEWLDILDLGDFAVLAENWGKCEGKAYGQCP